MRQLLKHIVFVMFCGLPAVALAQIEADEQTKNYIIEQRIENIAEANEDAEIDYTTMFDVLSNYYENPINLNNADKDQLLELQLLTEQQINALFVHIDKHGKLLSLYELQSVEGWDLPTILNILPFVRVSGDLNSPHISWNELFKNSNSELFLRWTRVLEEQEGFSDIEDSVLAESPNKRYLGSPDKLYLRYRFRYRQNISVGFTAEKDQGEEFFTGTQTRGFDFYSAHLFLRDFGKLKQLAVGDYHVQFGQGLTAWSGLAFGKSAQVMTLKRNAIGFRPYTAADENLFMRGGAATVGIKDFEFSAFYSQKRIDGNISEGDTLDQQVIVTSFQNSGFHRTPGELLDRDAIGERHMGGHFAYVKRRLNIGLTALASNYDGEVNRNLSVYNQFEFNDNQNFVVGADYNAIINNFNFYGEISRSKNGGIATLNGALITVDTRLSFSLLQRYYSRDFQNLISNAMAESSRNVNENGFFIGAEARPTKAFTINAYMDLFSFPWMRSDLRTPGQTGFDYLAQVNWKPSKKLEAYVRVRHREKPTNTDNDIDDIDFAVTKAQTNYRFHVSTKITEEIRLKSRVEWVQYDEGDNPRSNGFLIYQDVSYQKIGSPVTINLRYALFDTDDYDSRIYAYENDVLYYFSIPAYSSRGSRFYIVGKYHIARGIDFWLRYSQWAYTDRNTISSGLNMIDGSTRSELRAQLRFKF